ncbi:TIGR03943 family protein [Streptomyces sp. DSM 110735]|uniref:TIGR03943 family putative permease subunit n=1 Tax=Streptomyces sp. DSM 110735 TaxID=2775031 RepID=UPI0018F36D92|nr:TIGR03943 family protein [Streptomyces sp. DSM 110735]MBJ7901780.1 TIGR03943 family protein [Streptomyces sp. DSM 110735]
MRRTVQSALLLLTGAGLLHSSLLTTLYLRYVKEGLRPLLVASGVVLIALGVVNLVLELREGRRRSGGGTDRVGSGHVGHGDVGHGDVGHGHTGCDHMCGDDMCRAHTGAADMCRDHTGADHMCRDHTGADYMCRDHTGQEHMEHAHPDPGHDHGHDHSRAPKVAWLLALPALSLLVWAPPALGAYTASHASTKSAPPVRQTRFEPLPASTAPVPLTLTGFTNRVQQDPARSLKDRAVQLTGFVTPGGADGGWYLTRIIFTCCAADSQTVKLRMYGSDAPPANTWLSVTGTWHPTGTLGTRSAAAALDVHETRPMAQPINAYTDDLPLTVGS